MTAECDAEVRAAQKESEKLGILRSRARTMSRACSTDVYADVPWHLAEQRERGA